MKIKTLIQMNLITIKNMMRKNKTFIIPQTTITLNMMNHRRRRAAHTSHLITIYKNIQLPPFYRL